MVQNTTFEAKERQFSLGKVPQRLIIALTQAHI